VEEVEDPERVRVGREELDPVARRREQAGDEGVLPEQVGEEGDDAGRGARRALRLEDDQREAVRHGASGPARQCPGDPGEALGGEADRDVGRPLLDVEDRSRRPPPRALRPRSGEEGREDRVVVRDPEDRVAGPQLERDPSAQEGRRGPGGVRRGDDPLGPPEGDGHRLERQAVAGLGSDPAGQRRVVDEAEHERAPDARMVLEVAADVVGRPACGCDRRFRRHRGSPTGPAGGRPTRGGQVGSRGRPGVPPVQGARPGSSGRRTGAPGDLGPDGRPAPG
jgi:hypothetical protein